MGQCTRGNREQPGGVCMILVDRQIKQYLDCSKLSIHPFHDNALNPNSYDLHLGSNFQVALQRDELDPHDEDSICSSFKEVNTREAWLENNGFILGTSIETVSIPDDVIGIVKGKSSIARLGLSIEDAGYVDSGFSGQITFEIVNHHPSPVKLYAGMPIAQILFVQNIPCDVPYGDRQTSKYQNQTGATLSRYHQNGQRRGYQHD